jgi:hypothetical protein
MVGWPCENAISGLCAHGDGVAYHGMPGVVGQVGAAAVDSDPVSTATQ